MMPVLVNAMRVSLWDSTTSQHKSHSHSLLISIYLSIYMSSGVTGLGGYIPMYVGAFAHARGMRIPGGFLLT